MLKATTIEKPNDFKDPGNKRRTRHLKDSQCYLYKKEMNLYALHVTILTAYTIKITKKHLCISNILKMVITKYSKRII
jgi:hypothetical protein